MKAVYLERPGEPVKVLDHPDPKLRPGGAIVGISAAPVLSFMKRVLAGELGYAMATPSIPGSNAVGVIESVAEDVVGLKVGDQVFLAPPARLAWLSFAAIAYGGLHKGDFRPGETLIVNGATGNIGSCAVLVGLAVGAKRIVALGRDTDILEQLQSIDSSRIEIVEMKADLEENKRRIAAVGSGADLVYDMLGNVPTFAPTAAAIYALRRGGRAILMGGVQAAVDLPYSHVMLNEISIKGALMYPRSAPAELLNLMAAGLLELSKVDIRTFPLEQVNAALDPAEHSRGLSYAMLTP